MFVSEIRRERHFVSAILLGVLAGISQFSSLVDAVNFHNAVSFRYFSAFVA